MPRLISIPVGAVFGGLSVLGKVKIDGKWKWECRCVCEKIIYVRGNNLRSGAIISCKCLKLKRFVEMNTKHGHHGTPEYKAWENLKSRCTTNKNSPYYKDYAGRGIKVCKKWKESFSAFLEDMGERPTPKHEVDRIDNDGNYETGNCRWAVRRQQLRNTRVTHRLTVNGVTKSVHDWADESGVHPSTIKARLKVGKSPYDAVFGKSLRNNPTVWKPK